jgi:hypothetical protein
MASAINWPKPSIPSSSSALPGIGDNYAHDKFTGIAIVQTPASAATCREAAPEPSPGNTTDDANGVFGLWLDLPGSPPSIVVVAIWNTFSSAGSIDQGFHVA